MKIQFHLVITDGGSVRAVKNIPNLNWNEISIACTLDVPNALFRKPTLSAKITVPDEAAIQEPIEASVVENVKEAIQTSTGMEVRLIIESNNKENE